MKYNVFISYSRKDSEIIDRIEVELKRYGITCFIDRTGINPGEDYAEVIAKVLFESDLMLFVWSENSNQSKETANEVALAIDFEKPIIPFKIGKFQADYKLAYRLIRFNRIDVLTYNEQKIIELGEKIAAQLGKTLLRPEVDNNVQATPVEEPEVVVDSEIENDYLRARRLMKNYQVTEAFDALYPLALIEYKDSVDLLRYFTSKKTSKMFELTQEQIARLKQDSDNGILLAKSLYARHLMGHGDPKAFTLAKEAVNEGCIHAKLVLAKCYDLGVGVSLDNDMASKYMVEAMQEGDTAAAEEYYRYLYYGYNFKQDREEAVRKWEELDKAGDLLAAVYLADHYMQTVYWDKEKSIKYCQKGIENGMLELYGTLAVIESCDKYGNILVPEKYIERLIQGADRNVLTCISSLAMAYYQGFGVQKNMRHAERWAIRGAEAGDRWSMYLLNQIYYYGGDGIAEDEQKAWNWAKKGADLGDNSCLTALGNMCRDGYGFDGKQKKDCMKYYEDAVYFGGTGATDAHIELYKIYSEGLFGHAVDMRKALSYLKPLVEEENGYACLLYGKVLTDSRSPFCNEFMGVKCLRIACESGCGEAFYVLGKLHETGFGVVKDRALAEKMFAKASEHGYDPKR